MYMTAFPTYMPVHQGCAWSPWRAEEFVGASGTRVTDDCEPIYRGWELNPGLWKSCPCS